MELGFAAVHVFNVARRPDRLTAPPPWPQELALLCATALLAALGGRVEGWRSGLVWAPPYVAAAGVLGSARMRLLLAVSAAYGLLRLTGRVRHPARLTWPTLAARDIIHRLDERRSWRRAYAAAAARSPQARSSAERSTSGGWAPETP